MTNEIVQMQSIQSDTLTIEQVLNRVALVKEVLDKAMTQNVHYGIIPGCGSKPTLLKPGTERLCLLFRLSPSFQIITKDLPDNHREYQVLTTLKHIVTGDAWGEGVGCCSTMETKYCRRKDGSPSKNLADVYNTVLKMAKKRSQADAVLTATGASDLLTQDLEDLPDDLKNSNHAARATSPIPIVQHDALQPQHQKAYDEFAELMRNAEDRRKLDALYLRACNSFKSSTSLTKRCIDNTLNDLKTLYDWTVADNQEKQLDESQYMPVYNTN